jgi:hypothetical protein
VSPSWRDSLRFGLFPDRVVFARYGRGLRPRLIEKGSVAVEPARPEPWRAPLAALAGLLQKHAPRPAEAGIVLSNHFVRYLPLDPKPDLSGREEWREYAAHRFEETYGAKALDWDVRVAETKTKDPLLASAVDKAFIEAALGVFAGSRARLIFIEPSLVTAFNQAKAPQSPSFWFVLHEPGRMLLALVRDGVWQSVRGRRAGEQWREELPQMVERESALLGSEPCREVLLSSLAGDEQVYAMVAA